MRTHRTDPAPGQAKEHSSGSTQAQDVAQQYPVAPGAVEGDRAAAYDLSQLPRSEAAAHCVPYVRYLQQAPGH